MHNIIIILTAIIVLIFTFFVYAEPIIVNLSLFTEKVRGGSDDNEYSDNSLYIAPPIINPIADATNSAEIVISGEAMPKQVVKLYVNGKYVDEKIVKSDKNFVFKNINLIEGENEIKAKSVISNKESEYSRIVKIVYKNKALNLEIRQPQDGQNISNSDGQVKVEGKTDELARVIVNGYWAIVDNQGNFSYLLKLQKGENSIKIIATDEAGNKVEKEIKVKLE